MPKKKKIQSKIKDWLLAQRWGADQTKHQHLQPLTATKQNSSLWILVGQPEAGCMYPTLSSEKANTECEGLSHTQLGHVQTQLRCRSTVMRKAIPKNSTMHYKVMETEMDSAPFLLLYLQFKC